MASHLARNLLFSARPAPRVLLSATANSRRSLFTASCRTYPLAHPLIGSAAVQLNARPARFFSSLPEEDEKKLDAMQVPPIDGEERDNPKITALVEEVVSLSMMETMIFMRQLQAKLGITDEMIFPSTVAAAPAAAAAAPAAGGDAPAEEQAQPEAEKKAFTVKITELGSGRVKVMKEIRTLTGFGLKEVQALANNLPANIGENLDQEKADKWAEALKGAGATVEVV